MKRKICVRSMFLGAVIMLIGLSVGAIVSPPLIAQRNGVFDEIQCTKLTVVDNMGKKAVELDGSERVNEIVVYNKQGGRGVVLHNSELGSFVTLADKQGKGAIVLSSYGDLVAKEDWSSVTIYNKQGKGVVMLHSTEYGGRVDVLNNQAKNRATMGVNEYGNGGVSTWDKNGYRQ